MAEHDTRILCSGDFVAEIIGETEMNARRYIRVGDRKTFIDNSIKEKCRQEGVTEQELKMGGEPESFLEFERRFRII